MGETSKINRLQYITSANARRWATVSLHFYLFIFYNIGVFNNKVYYNITASNDATSEIRKYSFNVSADTQVLLINNNGQTVKERITELVIQNNSIKYTVYRWPVSGSEQYAVRLPLLPA